VTYGCPRFDGDDGNFLMAVTQLTKTTEMAAGEEEVRAIWKMADAVCFDVDSTVIQEEAIDELARFCGKGDEVAKM